MKGIIKIKYLLISTVVFLSFIVQGQNLNMDSLEQEFTFANSPLQKIEILKELFFEVQFSNPDKAFQIAKETRAISLLTGDKPGELKLESLNLLGIAFMNMSQNDSALFYFQKMQETAALVNDSAFLSKAFNNLGAVNYYQGNPSTAAFYFNKSAEIDHAMGDIEGSIISFMNIGSLYLVEKSLDSARFFLTKALEGAVEIDNKGLVATCYLNLGGIDFQEKNYPDAKQHFFMAIEVGEMVSDYDVVSSAYRNLARLFQDQDMYKIAIEYDKLSLEYALKWDGLSGAKSAYLGLAVSYENLGMYKEAYENHKQYTAVVDTMRERQNRSSFIEMQEKYKSEQALKENEILTQKSKIKDLEIAKGAEEIQNSKIVIFSSIVGLILLVVLAVTLYNRNVLKQRANLKLQDAYAIIHEKNADILASIDYASKIQEALLPTKENYTLFKDSFFLLTPKDIVSGDFLWYAEVSGKKIIAAVDCTGHGVPGAFMSMIGNTFLHQIVNERGITNPAEILMELRRNVIRALNQKGDGINRKDGMDMALCVLDESLGTVEFAGANNPLFMVRKGEMVEIKGDKLPVGYFEGKEIPFTNHTLQISKGDCVYLFSDGYADQFGGPKGKKFKYKQLRDLIFRNFEKPMQDQKRILITAFNDWKGPLEQVDDVCLVGIRVS